VARLSERLSIARAPTSTSLKDAALVAAIVLIDLASFSLAPPGHCRGRP
jgi:hypothetical protein